MARLSRCALVVALVSLGALSGLEPRSARADEPSADVLIERGLDLRQEKRDAEALVLFEKAQSLSPTPRGQAQVALAQQALGRWALAERNLLGALAARNDAWIESRRPILEQALGVIVARLGDVQITGVTTGDVFVDGVRMTDPDAHSHLRLEVGRRILEVRARDMYPISRTVDVRAGEVARIEVEQRALLADVAPAPTLAGTAAPNVAAVVEPARVQRNLGWVLLGGAGLLTLTGASGLVLHDVSASDFNGNVSCTTTPSGALSSTCRSYQDNGSTGQTLEVVGFVGGGLFAATAVALIVTAPKVPSRVSAFVPSCGPSRGGALCAFNGGF